MGRQRVGDTAVGASTSIGSPRRIQPPRRIRARTPPRPTCLLTYRHPCTGQAVTVPLALPEGTPTIQYKLRQVVYNYGSYAVEVHFLPDGSVAVVYNSGLFRAL